MFIIVEQRFGQSSYSCKVPFIANASDYSGPYQNYPDFYHTVSHGAVSCKNVRIGAQIK